MGSFSIRERFTIWIAWHLPRKVMYWAIIRATTEYSIAHPTREMTSITGVETTEGYGP